MTANSDELELKDRLNLIETMIAEGRRTTESWGWVFVLWGVAYYAATAWATWGHTYLAWPVTMTVACVLTGYLISLKRSRRPKTTIGRAIGSVWEAMGISMLVLFFSLGMTGRFEYHTFVAIVGAMLGTANATSSLILKWKMQFACAVVWWATTVAACLGTAAQTTIAFLAATFFCQIVFGVYCTIRESSKRAQGAAHA
ncbi:MAG: hypothetical protein P4K86_09715 [Terracidiphilus sp.]|nr:hypothetical protein [Terracidiphilus sp.]